MLLFSGSSRCDDGDGEYIGKVGEGFVGIAGLHTIVIHTGEENLSGTTFVGFLGPIEQVFVGFYASAIQIAFPSLGRLFGIDGHHTNL